MPSLLDDDFSRGIVRQVEGQRIPKGGVYDCVNGLLDDDLGVYRRGGSAYKSTSNAAATPLGLAVAPFLGGITSVIWTAAGTYALDGSGVPQLGATGAAGNRWPGAFRRPAFGGNLMAFGNVNFGTAGGWVTLWGGSRKAVDYATGTATVASGTTAVTGAGTAWLANVDAGMVFTSPFNDGFALVKSVNSDTSITLDRPWPGASIAASGYTASRMRELTGLFLPSGSVPYVAMAGSPPRILAGAGSLIYFSNPNSGGSDSWAFNAEQYHQLPGGSIVTGLDAIGDTGVVFSTEGVWALRNLNFDLTDAYGNPQQSMARVSKDLLLWGDAGVAGWRGGLIVPAIDSVHLFDVATGETNDIGHRIRPLLQGYVRSGYQPGLAAVHRGHYFLPVLNGTTLVDVLVCRLDGASPAWTRWSGHAAGTAYAQEVGSTTRSPKLYGLASLRVTDLTDCFVPSGTNKNDADASSHVLTVITRDYSLRAHTKAFWRAVRARFELTDAATDNPTLTAEYAVGPVAGESWTSAGSWAEGTGESPTRLAVGKSAQSIRFRFKTSGACASAVLRSLEVFARGSRKS